MCLIVLIFLKRFVIYRLFVFIVIFINVNFNLLFFWNGEFCVLLLFYVIFFLYYLDLNILKFFENDEKGIVFSI